MMRKNILIFNYLCQASQELNTIFSVPVFILLTAKFISVVTAAFAFSYNYFIRSSAILNSYSSFFCYLFFADWFKIMVLLAVADMPANQVSHTIISSSPIISLLFLFMLRSVSSTKQLPQNPL